MSDDLIEAVAKGLFDTHHKMLFWHQASDAEKSKWRSRARAAIAAIEASGKWCVVPLELTEEMAEAAASTGGAWPDAEYDAMLAARPKIGETE